MTENINLSQTVQSLFSDDHNNLLKPFHRFTNGLISHFSQREGRRDKWENLIQQSRKESIWGSHLNGIVSLQIQNQQGCYNNVTITAECNQNLTELAQLAQLLITFLVGYRQSAHWILNERLPRHRNSSRQESLEVKLDNVAVFDDHQPWPLPAGHLRH